MNKYIEDPHALNIYTDGSSFSRPRRGGMGMVFVFPEYLNKATEEVCPLGYKKATNNQMEIMACVVALEESLKFERKWQRIVIHTDSMYVCDNQKRAINWSQAGWTKIGGAPVANINQWKALLKMIKKVGVSVDFCRVKGHSKNEHNIMADNLADRSSKKAVQDPLGNINLRRKNSTKHTKIGSVKMHGQKMKIRIISSEPIPKKSILKYRYEVSSKQNKFFDCIDFIYSKEILRVGHIFSVKVNKNQTFPQIIKVYKDYTKEAKIKKLQELITDPNT